MTRHMASIKEILGIEPIENANSIELARIDGWKSVVRKGQFQIGEKVVFCEPDSLLPERPEFEFMRSKHFRIKTCRLRGTTSQGICFPLSILPEGYYSLDDDVSELLGITKYEVPIPVSLRGRVRCQIHRLAVPKTDEVRVQNIPKILEKYRGQIFNMTEKLDGCIRNNTIISLPYINMTVEELFNIKYSGKIISYDIIHDKFVLDDIVKIIKTTSSKQWYKLHLEDGKTIVVTSDHLVYLSEEQIYKPVKELVVGDLIGELDNE